MTVSLSSTSKMIISKSDLNACFKMYYQNNICYTKYIKRVANTDGYSLDLVIYENNRYLRNWAVIFLLEGYSI